nr:MAG TPA: hypothetical protein [Caudoviricetes sp.]
MFIQIYRIYATFAIILRINIFIWLNRVKTA